MRRQCSPRTRNWPGIWNVSRVRLMRQTSANTFATCWNRTYHVVCKRLKTVLSAGIGLLVMCPRVQTMMFVCSHARRAAVRTNARRRPFALLVSRKVVVSPTKPARCRQSVNYARACWPIRATMLKSQLCGASSMRRRACCVIFNGLMRAHVVIPSRRCKIWAMPRDARS